MQNYNKNQDLVTIATVTYNAEDLLEETILSVINQSYENIEYIIIDGASTDKTIDIIKKYEDKISYWASEPDEGIYFAMNKAIEKASGEWINFMNAGDTFFMLDSVAYVMKQKDQGAELIYGDYQIKENSVIRKARDKSQWYTYMPFCHQTLFTRTSIMKDELFDTSFKLAADHNFILKMYCAEKKFEYIEKTIAVFEAGGYAESNRFLMYIESLKVLLGNNVPEDIIKKSTWYMVLSNDMCIEIKHKLNKKQAMIEERNSRLTAQDEMIKKQKTEISTLKNHLKMILNTIEDITKKSIKSNPIQKYKAYKTMLSIFYNLRRYYK